MGFQFARQVAMLPAMECPDDGRLLALVEGDLSEADAQPLRTHLDECGDCRVAVAEAARAHYPEGEVRELRAGEAMGRYQVTAKIGEGGMGVVYAAVDPRLKRKVALKVLRPSALAHRGASERLLREAQAMARLSHPSVVAVYDVGTVGDQLFLAMEHIDGVTLARWLEERPRGHREIVRAFARAAEGLAAAHAAGLVHRDFKPDNVLVAADGRVLVTDFGLARAPLEEPDEGAAAPAERDLGVLTETGAVAGTPAFMAPEQLEGKRLDAKSDQFSFCVALYAALHGERPFAGNDLASLRAAVLAGRVRPPSGSRKVPEGVRRALLRGLRADPDARFPSMAALLAAIERRPRRRLMIAASVILACVAAAGAMLVDGRSPCGPATDRLAGVWDAARKQEVGAAFRATGSPLAEEVWRRVEVQLDAYAAAWLSMGARACEATRVRGDQSEDLLDLRRHCLDQRLGALSALVALFAEPDRALIERALEAVETLPTVEGCARTWTPRSRVEPPRALGVAAEVEQVRAKVASAHALERVGRYARAIETARAAVAAARPLGYPPIEAEALFALGLAQGRNGDLGPAEKTLEEAIFAAQAGAHDELAARALIKLMHFIGYQSDRYAEGHRWNEYAVAALTRLGDPGELEADRLLWLSAILAREGRSAESLVAAERQLALVERAFGKEHVRYAYALVSVSFALGDLGRKDEAAGMEERACQLVEKLLGSSHPQVIQCLSNRSVALSRRGRFAEALPLKVQALRLAERLENKAPLPTLHTNLAATLISLEQFAEARAELEIAGKLATRITDRIAVEEGLGAVARGQRSLARALEHYRAALALITKELGANHPDAAKTHCYLADVLLELDRAKEALEHAERALTLADASNTPTAGAATALLMVGESRLALAASRLAIPPLERSLEIQAAQEGEPLLLARTRFALARALAASGGSPDRIEDLLGAARAGYGTTDLAGEELRALEAWSRRRR